MDADGLTRGLVLLSPWRQLPASVRRLDVRSCWMAERRLRALALTQEAPAVADAWAACGAVNFTGRLRAMRAPALVVAGLNDLLTPTSLARAVARELTAATLEVWEACGHFPNLEALDRMNRRIEAFLHRVICR
jgi:pimeloyl-ACP methyl ester carboxylesterase